MIRFVFHTPVEVAPRRAVLHLDKAPHEVEFLDGTVSMDTERGRIEIPHSNIRYWVWEGVNDDDQIDAGNGKVP